MSHRNPASIRTRSTFSDWTDRYPVFHIYPQRYRLPLSLYISCRPYKQSHLKLKRDRRLSPRSLNHHQMRHRNLTQALTQSSFLTSHSTPLGKHSKTLSRTSMVTEARRNLWRDTRSITIINIRNRWRRQQLSRHELLGEGLPSSQLSQLLTNPSS